MTVPVPIVEHKRYFLDQLHGKHIYVVPDERHDDWLDWCEANCDDEQADPPEWAVYATRDDTTRVTFENPKVEDR